jgi:uncharacterized protein YggE
MYTSRRSERIQLPFRAANQAGNVKAKGFSPPAIHLFAVFMTGAARAEITRAHIITVNGGGRVLAPPNLAILILVIQ